MYELPLFPLNSVLFPTMPVTLYIFEERYKRMMSTCIKEHSPFGIVLIKEGQETGDAAVVPYQIGCSAQIVQMQLLEEEHMSIIAIGVERFRILDLNYANPYLAGNVEPYPFVLSPPITDARIANQLRPWVVRYVDMLSQVSDAELESSDLPHDPLAFGYLAAYLLQIEPFEKQAVLEIADTTTFLQALLTLYRREVSLLHVMLAKPPVVEEQGPFSFLIN